jgi:hypothetical protein
MDPPVSDSKSLIEVIVSWFTPTEMLLDPDAFHFVSCSLWFRPALFMYHLNANMFTKKQSKPTPLESAKHKYRNFKFQIPGIFGCA